MGKPPYPLKLEPWQRAVLEAAYAGEAPNLLSYADLPAYLEQRRGARREAAALGLATSAIAAAARPASEVASEMSRAVAICSTSYDEARALMHRASRYARTVGFTVGEVRTNSAHLLVGRNGDAMPVVYAVARPERPT